MWQTRSAPSSRASLGFSSQTAGDGLQSTGFRGARWITRRPPSSYQLSLYFVWAQPITSIGWAAQHPRPIAEPLLATPKTHPSSWSLHIPGRKQPTTPLWAVFTHRFESSALGWNPGPSSSPPFAVANPASSSLQGWLPHTSNKSTPIPPYSR